MVCLVGRNHDLDPAVVGDGDGGTSGSNFLSPHMTLHRSNKNLKDHLETIAKDRTERQKADLSKYLKGSAPENGKGTTKQQHQQTKQVSINVQGQGDSKDLEEVDIHMQRPVEKKKSSIIQRNSSPRKPNNDNVLRAYLEPIFLDDWEKKPLPMRNTTASQLKVREYPQLSSCKHFVEQFPIDDFPDEDSFLPWIHEVFPTEDGTHIQFVAQNKRRCRTGTTPDELAILEHMQPQVALFQHVPVKRISKDGEARYQLTSHELADADGMETRFICQFSTGQETLSKHNVNYDYASFRKGYRKTFSKEGNSKVGKDNKHLHTSQLIFQCPVPGDLIHTVKAGTSVKGDTPSLFVNLIPIRTPPRYGPPAQFLPPRFADPSTNQFKALEEWGTEHILPRIEDSGRWENIPICKPTSLAYPVSSDASKATVIGNEHKTASSQGKSDQKNHRLVACTWASTSYATRGDRFAISDGFRRLDEWIRFHLLAGVEHIYVYDNSAAHGDGSLKPVTDQFPGQVTRIVWPCKICNNNKNFEDSPGERSSQYAAETSCRLRFGPNTDWIANMDIDEYMVPVGKYKSLLPLLDDLDKEGKKIISFGSWRAWPRADMIETPVPILNRTICDENKPCFHLKVPMNRTILQGYNCDRQLVKQEQMPAEKQIYRPDYVLQHFVHYSTITVTSQMSPQEVKEAGQTFGVIHTDPLSRFSDEQNEVTMLHTKAIATQDTSGWQTRCKGEAKGTCRIGHPFPSKDSNATADPDGWLYNCYVNPHIENYFVPLLEESMKDSIVRRQIS